MTERIEVPIEPGVYEFAWAPMPNGYVPEKPELAQLDIDGNWWPFPYMFSGWRASELSTFAGVKPRPDLQMDCPARSPMDKQQAKMDACIEELMELHNQSKKIVKRYMKAHNKIAKMKNLESEDGQ